ncbi:MAG: 50S ribosomal protein L4 [Pirellulales bacterium]|nr:50S ribosomal protein L4 [Pirellulales bacterium]
MATLTVYDEAGGEVGKYEIDTEQIADRVSKQLMHDAVVMYQANLRQGSHNTRTRSEVSGSTKKLYRQKGTGNARAGSKRTNVRRGGGVARTVKPRDYSYRMNRKAIQLATRMAIRSKIDDGEVVVVDKLGFDGPRTRQMAAVLKALGLDGTTTLVATADYDLDVYKSGRNIEGVSVQPVRELNALSVLKPRRMLVTKDALDKIKNGSFSQSGAGPSEAEGQAETESQLETEGQLEAEG